MAKGEFTEGSVSTAASISAASSIAYGTGAQSAAELLADKTGLAATASDAVAPDTVLLTLGTDFHTSEYVDGLASTWDATTTNGEPSQTTVAATAAGGGRRADEPLGDERWWRALREMTSATRTWPICDLCSSPGSGCRLRPAAQLEASRILIAKMSESPGWIPAPG